MWQAYWTATRAAWRTFRWSLAAQRQTEVTRQRHVVP